MGVRFKPDRNRMVADIIPFFDQGYYHVFYLKGFTEESGWPRNLTPWGHIKSNNLIDWGELEDAILPGYQTEHDGGACYTGSVIRAGNQVHIFYTGFHPGNPTGRESILHATSSDGIHFEKDLNNPVLILQNIPQYGTGEDLRDPYVFWNTDEQCYWMLFTTGINNCVCGIKRGCIALAKSQDLINWTVQDPLYSPNYYPSLECPDLFKMGDWWYLVFSQYGLTEYRKSKSPNGPWETPKYPTFDAGCLFFYAAKTIFDGNRRFLLGWTGELAGRHDAPFALWGGWFVTPREILQKRNGDLYLSCPKEFMLNVLDHYTVSSIKPVCGQWFSVNDSIVSESPEGFSACFLGQNEQNTGLEFGFQVGELKGHTGILLNSSDDLSSGYHIDFDLGQQLITIERYKTAIPFTGAYPDGYRILCQRRFDADNQTSINVKVVLEDNIMELFFCECTVTVPFEDFKKGNIGLFTRDTSAIFSDVRLLIK